MAREVFEPFAGAPAQRRETHRFRSSWLASSLRALKQRDLLDAYRRHLPERYHQDVLQSIAGVWLPIEVAKAHYAAIDALGLSPTTCFEMGQEIQDHSQNIIKQVALLASKAAGVTPWTLIGKARALWNRTWEGGDFAVFKNGPKEVEWEIVAWSVAPSPYVHQAMRGVIQGALGLFCERVYAKELPAKSKGLDLAYRIAWV